MDRKSSCSRKYYNDRYVPPLEELLRRNERWNPKKAKKERELQELCRQEKLKPFEQPKHYSRYYIHEKTDMETMDKLIDEAKLTFNYTLDTEGDAYNRISAATIQVEFIRPNSPSIVIIIEVNYLPPISSPLFIKIRQLCSIIFTSNNRIYAWGYVADELKSFMNLNLFSGQIKADGVNVQNEYDRYELYGLQAVVKSTFGQYLDKTATLAKWSCGIDRSLDTYKPKYVHGREYDYRVQEETKYRHMLEEYAINDVFAVTKVAYDMNLIKFVLTPPATVENEKDVPVESTTQQEPTVELKPPNRDEPEAHAYVDSREEEHPGQQESISIELELTPSDLDIGIFDHENESSPVEMEEEPIESPSQKVQPTPYVYEPISDDEFPEVMKLHRPFPQPDPTPEERKRIHAQDESQKVRNSYYLGPQLYLQENPTPNQISNRRRRSNRYRSEVIYPVHRLFKHAHIKQILRSKNIQFLNINIKHGKVFIGVCRHIYFFPFLPSFEMYTRVSFLFSLFFSFFLYEPYIYTYTHIDIFLSFPRLFFSLFLSRSLLIFFLSFCQIYVCGHTSFRVGSTVTGDTYLFIF
uniref:Putative envelope protein n=1 Tax=Adineta vaga TaxID=104782 RepID=A1YGT5_ADIVA|nr:putative envelope protein [Adineta vaga]